VRLRAPPASPSGVRFRERRETRSRGEAEASPDDRSLHGYGWRRRWTTRGRSLARRWGMEPRLHSTTFAGQGRGPIRQRQPPATSRGFTGQGPDEPKLLPAGSTVSAFAGGGLAPGHPRGLPGSSATPTRSARTPLVMGSWPRRLESPAWPAPLRSGSDADDDPTARAPPPRRVGSRGPSTTRLREAACEALRARLATRPKSQRRDVSLARTHPGPGPLSPCLREEARDWLHPRCLPSVNRHAAPGAAEALPRATRAERAARWPGSFPQVVANLWKIHDAF
jgi:hypothetical protein